MAAHPGFDERVSGWNRPRWLKAGFSRRTAGIAYRCCLPALAGFAARRRTRPTYQRSVGRATPQTWAGAREFSSAKADCRCRAPLSPHLARPKIRRKERKTRDKAESEIPGPVPHLPPLVPVTRQGGIRTHEALTPTRVPVVLLKPLGHLSLRLRIVDLGARIQQIRDPNPKSEIETQTGRDSNSRYEGYPYDGFRDRCLQPLGHLSSFALALGQSRIKLTRTRRACQPPALNFSGAAPAANGKTASDPGRAIRSAAHLAPKGRCAAGAPR